MPATVMEPPITLHWERAGNRLATDRYAPLQSAEAKVQNLGEALFEAVVKNINGTSESRVGSNVVNAHKEAIRRARNTGDPETLAAARKEYYDLLEKHAPDQFRDFLHAEQSLAEHTSAYQTATQKALQAVMNDHSLVHGFEDASAVDVKAAARKQLTALETEMADTQKALTETKATLGKVVSRVERSAQRALESARASKSPIHFYWDREELIPYGGHPLPASNHTLNGCAIDAWNDAQRRLEAVNPDALLLHMDKHAVEYASNDPARIEAADRGLRKLMQEHAPHEFQALQRVEAMQAEVTQRLHAAEVETLEKISRTGKVEGRKFGNKGKIKQAAAAQLEVAQEKLSHATAALAETKTVVEAAKPLEEAAAEAEKAGKTKIGFANLSHNIGGKAWKRSKGVAFGNTVVTLLGAGLTWDAVVHANRKDENGERTVHRSGLVRTGEGIVGVAAVVASALRGGHSRAL